MRILMNKLIHAIIATFMLLAASALSAANAEDQKVESFFKAYLDEYFRLQPVQATKLGDHRFDAQLEDVSPEARKQWLASTERALKALPKQINYSQLTRQAQI